MGRLDRLELSNFKSYGGNVVVGPLMGFTAIIGTNGSGKSNLMDAISFVLGVRTSQLRGNQLRDLVYRNLEDSTDDPSRRKAYVKLVYKHGNENDPSSEIEFMRSVTLSGASEYRVRGTVVNLEKYNEELAGIGVLVKARNFLVFQNEVESIASKAPKELSSLFEEVSESAEFRVEYDDARVEKDAAEEEVTHFWRKRKGMAAEKRQYKEQKDEAERFRRLENQIAAMKTEKALFELFHVDEDLRAVKTEVTDVTDELEVKQRQFSKKESVLNEEKKHIAELDKQRPKLERKRKRLADEIEKLRPTEVKLETEKSGLTRRIKGDERSLSKLQEEFTKGTDTISLLESKLEQCTQEISALQSEIEEAEEASVSAESMAEYRSLKDIVATRTSALQQQLEVIKRNVAGTSKEKLAIERREGELRDRVATASKDGEVYRRRAEELQSQVNSSKQEIRELEHEQSRVAEVGGERRKVREQLEKTVNEVTQALRDAKADMNESGRERAASNAFETMQRLFPGVHGRLSDLCQPTQTRYREAVAVIFGKMMDAIVVENEKVGGECIRFLKDQRVGIETFIPLQDVRPRPVDESLRRLGGTSRLVVDVVKHRDFVQKAVLYAAGNSVVCDTLDEARRLRYDGGRKIKICALDGTLINKAGFMTGGVSRSDMGRSRKWDRAEIDALKRKRQSAQRELQALGAAETDRRSAASLAEKVDEVRRRLSILDQDWRDASSRAQVSDRDAELSSTEKEQLVPQLRVAIQAFKKANEKLQKVEARLRGLENELFGDFTERHNIESVQQFEEQFVGKSEKMREKKLELETKELSLKTSLKYEKNQHNRTSVVKLQKKIESQRAKRETIEDNLKNLSTKRAELDSRAESVGKEIDEALAQRQEIVELLTDKRQEFRKESESVAETKKILLQKRSKLEQLQSQRSKLLLAAKVAQVNIPTRDADSNDEDEVEKLANERDTDGDIIMGREGEGDGDGSNPASMAIDVNMTIEYSSLSRRHRAAATVDKQKEMLDSYFEKIRTMEQQLDGLAPNMKATEHMTEVNEKIEAMDREADEARERARKAVSNFEDIKQKRQDRFSSCFTHVANKINEVYRQLTRSTAYPMGGTAYLSLEQQDEPYLGGIKFNAMPPTKRFRDMEQLSGGERTVAALALLFAIHDFRPSPFFVLDEVDAALDNLNVGRVSAYIKSRARDLQIIVISLKDSFYERADALVGIYRDASSQSSRLLTLDLTTFDEVPQS